VAEVASGLLKADDLKKVVPATYFFRGQSATVQLRNSAGFSADGKLVLAGLVDTGGYSTDVKAKYQGFFITEIKLNVGGTELAPGEYGFGFSKEGKFSVLNVSSEELFSVSAQTDSDLKRPVPLTMKADGDGYKLYAGRQWVALKAE
jgi:hypothetical protein